MFRDPRYLLPLAILVGVIIVSGTLVRRGSHHAHAARGTLAAPGGAPLDDVLLDSRRTLDLVRLKEALKTFHDRNHAYPTTADAVTTVCASPADAGCALSSVTTAPSFSDGAMPYWYVSDGATYATLVAHAQTGGDRAQCPAALPPELQAAPLICITLKAGD